MSREDRNRLAVQRDQIDLLSADRASQPARMLCQVYDGGAIPTTVPKVFLTHPTWSNVGDAEGATDSPYVDTATSIPVLFLGPKVPVAGDMAVAHAVGGRWVAREGSGGVCNVYINDKGCGKNLAGVTVSVYDHAGGTLLDSGVTDSSGNVYLAGVVSSGTYWITATGAPTGFDDFGASVAIACGATNSIVQPVNSGYFCCSACPIPKDTLNYTIALSGGPGCGTTSGTATWSGYSWCLGFGCLLEVRCNPATGTLILDMDHGAGHLPYGCIVPIASFTCDPISMEFDVNLTNCPGFSASGCTSMVVTLTP